MVVGTKSGMTGTTSSEAKSSSGKSAELDKISSKPSELQVPGDGASSSRPPARAAQPLSPTYGWESAAWCGVERERQDQCVRAPARRCIPSRFRSAHSASTGPARCTPLLLLVQDPSSTMLKFLAVMLAVACLAQQANSCAGPAQVCDVLPGMVSLDVQDVKCCGAATVSIVAGAIGSGMGFMLGGQCLHEAAGCFPACTDCTQEGDAVTAKSPPAPRISPPPKPQWRRRRRCCAARWSARMING